MAVYTYECPVCERRWDENRSMNDDAASMSLETCAHMSGDLYGYRVWVPNEFRAVFVGRGWARKDHKDASKP